MKRKRLDRDIWWEHNRVKFPRYYQMRVDTEDFCGLICLIQMIDGPVHYWELPIAGKTAIIGKGMSWLQLIPDGKNHIATAMLLPDDTVSLWYVDVIESIEYDTDGVAVFYDKYLDVIFTPQGDARVDDRDELYEALRSDDITREQYDAALAESDAILREYCADIRKTELRSMRILAHVHGRIISGEKQMNPMR